LILAGLGVLTATACLLAYLIEQFRTRRKPRYVHYALLAGGIIINLYHFLIILLIFFF